MLNILYPATVLRNLLSADSIWFISEYYRHFCNIIFRLLTAQNPVLWIKKKSMFVSDRVLKIFTRAMNSGFVHGLDLLYLYSNTPKHWYFKIYTLYETSIMKNKFHNSDTKSCSSIQINSIMFILTLILVNLKLFTFRFTSIIESRFHEAKYRGHLTKICFFLDTFVALLSREQREIPSLSR